MIYNNNNFNILLKQIINKNLDNNIIKYVKEFPHDSYFHSLLKIKNKNKLKSIINVILKILSNIELVKIKKNEIIFYYNDYPDSVYFIFYGKIGVLIPSNINNNSNIPNDFFEEHNDNPKLKKDLNYYLATKLHIGKVFGDYSLDEELTKRTATCFSSSEYSILGKLDKEKYNQLLKEINQEKIYKLFKFYNKVFENSFNLNQILSINLKFKLKSYRYNEKILLQNSQINNIYIVKKGRINLYEEIEINLLSLNDQYNSNLANKNYVKFLNNKIKNYNKKTDLKKKIVILVKNLCEGDTIGIYEYNNKNKNVFYSIISVEENTKVYNISHRNLNSLMISNKNLKRCIKKSSENYKFYYDRKIKTINLWRKKLNIFDSSSWLFLNLNKEDPLRSLTNQTNFNFYINKYNIKLKQENEIINAAKKKNIDLLHFDIEWYNNVTNQLAKFRHNIANENLLKKKNFEDYLKKFKIRNIKTFKTEVSSKKQIKKPSKINLLKDKLMNTFSLNQLKSLKQISRNSIIQNNNKFNNYNYNP